MTEGKIVYSTNKHLQNTLGQIFKGDDVAVTQALSTILNTREQTEKVELKHYKRNADVHLSG